MERDADPSLAENSLERLDMQILEENARNNVEQQESSCIAIDEEQKIAVLSSNFARQNDRCTDSSLSPFVEDETGEDFSPEASGKI